MSSALTNRRVMAGLLELGAQAGDDGTRSAHLLAVLRGSETVHPDLPRYEEVRMILGLASPVIMTPQDNDRLLAALEAFSKAAISFESLIRKFYYAQEIH